jgi:hypothetical protein
VSIVDHGQCADTRPRQTVAELALHVEHLPTRFNSANVASLRTYQKWCASTSISFRAAGHRWSKVFAIS